MTPDGWHIARGVRPEHTAAAAALYWDAFGAKLGKLLGPPERGRAFIERVLDPSHAISAIDDGGALLGLAGFKTAEGACVDGEFEDLVAVFGLASAVWRGALLAALERPVEPGRLLMDGIAVAPEARGRGVGTRLLDAIVDEAAARGADAVRLDVIDTNPRARALYARRGFEPVGTERTGWLYRRLLGFDSATTMIRRVDAVAAHDSADGA